MSIVVSSSSSEEGLEEGMRRSKEGEEEMGKAREDGAGVDSRGRGSKRSNRYPLVMLMAFVVVVAVTTLINMHTPVGFNQTYSEGKRHGKDSFFGTWKALRRPEAAEEVINPYTPVRPDPQSSSGWSRNWLTMLPGAAKDELFHCQRTHIRTDICRMHGIVHLVGNASLVLNAMDKKTIAMGEEKIRPYSRKWEKLCMDKVAEVTLKSDYGGSSNSSRVCEVWHKTPAVVFSTGGYTGNVYHEFNDGLIPLYITSQHLKGKVVFVIVDYHDWWMVRYQDIMKKLSKYEVIDIANHTQSHCFTDVTVGLFIHKELGIDHSLMPNHESIRDFRALLSSAYPVEDSGWEQDFRTFGSSVVPAEGMELGWAVPQLVIINREGSRTIVNLDQVVEMATRGGFNVTILQPDPTTEMKKIFWLLDRCDVLVGVHGAALTHFLFMRPRSVFIQIVPLGTDWAARTYYGDPAKRLGLHYFEYKINIEESSLSSEYDKTDPVLANPNAVVQQGWSVIKEIYLGRQNVILSLPRFRKTLEAAKVKWKADPAPPTENIVRARSYRRHTSPGGTLETILGSQLEESNELGSEGLRVS